MIKRRMIMGLGIGLIVIVIVVVGIVIVFAGTILNGPIRGRLERNYTKAHPETELHIGKMEYSLRSNRLFVQSASLKTAKKTLELGPLSLTGVHWLGLLLGTAHLSDACKDARLDVQNFNLKFTQEYYGISCSRLQVLVPESEIMAEVCELKPLLENEAFFSQSAYRKTRFRLLIPQCRVSGLLFADLLGEKSFQARLVELIRPSLYGLANLDKPSGRFIKSPLMVGEALASIKRSIKIDKLLVSDGLLTYCERVIANAPPGVLTITKVDMSIEGITSRAQPNSAVNINAQGKLMNKGELKLQMTIPLVNDKFSLHYSGSLGAMDLTKLNAFLEKVEHTRLRSGTVQSAVFKIDVTNGQAIGYVRSLFKDLAITLLNKNTGSKKGLGNRIASLFANLFKIRHGSARDSADETIDGQINYLRSPDNTFVQFVWFALRSGVLDVISR